VLVAITPRLGASGNVEIVVANGDVGDDAELWRGAKQVLVDRSVSKHTRPSLSLCVWPISSREGAPVCPVFGVTLAVEDDSGFVKEGVGGKTLVFAHRARHSEIVNYVNTGRSALMNERNQRCEDQ